MFRRIFLLTILMCFHPAIAAADTICRVVAEIESVEGLITQMQRHNGNHQLIMRISQTLRSIDKSPLSPFAHRSDFGQHATVINEYITTRRHLIMIYDIAGPDTARFFLTSSEFLDSSRQIHDLMENLDCLQQSVDRTNNIQPAATSQPLPPEEAQNRHNDPSNDGRSTSGVTPSPKAAINISKFEPSIFLEIMLVLFAILLGCLGYLIRQIILRSQRRAKRYFCYIKTLLLADDKQFTTVIYDISRVGAKLAKVAEIPNGADVKIDIGNCWRPSTIIWQNTNYVGVQFSNAIEDSELKSIGVIT